MTTRAKAKAPEGFLVTCSVCEKTYTAYRKQRPGFCSNLCQVRDGRRKRGKAAIWAEYHGLSIQSAMHPETGKVVPMVEVKFTPRGWELVGRYCAGHGQTAEEWVAEELQESWNDILGPLGLEVSDTEIVQGSYGS